MTSAKQFLELYIYQDNVRYQESDSHFKKELHESSTIKVQIFIRKYNLNWSSRISENLK